MQVLRLNEVLMRVVAWHNRHPLARRINASQVHSIGEVLLPFAASQPALAPPLPPSGTDLPGMADLLDPTQAATPSLPDANSPDANRPETNRPDDLGPVDLGLVVATGTTPDAGPSGVAAAAASAGDADLTPDQAESWAVDLGDPIPPLASASAEMADPASPQARPATAPLQRALSAALQNTPTAAAPPNRLRRLLARLTGRQPSMPRLQSIFSRDFIWPLSPRRVARWARDHGQLQPLAPADWPRRVVETDSAMLGTAHRKGLAHSVELHLLTAAIGVGDRRLRVLMDARGTVIGPRAYSRPRVAATAAVLGLTLLGLGWHRLQPLLPDGSAVLAAASAALAAAAPAGPAAPAAPAAPATSTPASAAALTETATAAEAAAMAATHTLMAAAVASTPEAAASDGQHADATAPPPPEAAAPTATPHVAPIHAADPATTGLPAPVAALPPTAATPATAPAATAADGHTAALGHIRPALLDEDKQAARAQAAVLRGRNAAAPRTVAATATVYAVVTPPSPQREVASAGLGVMQRAGGRMPLPVPEHGELMQNQGAWRAAWWPFASLADAERARVLLAGKGLKVEVVEF